jgi:hypothetical protein
MARELFPRIRRFFEGTGRVVSTPSGDARGHVNPPDRQMYDLLGSDRFLSVRRR